MPSSRRPADFSPLLLLREVLTALNFRNRDHAVISPRFYAPGYPESPGDRPRILIHAILFGLGSIPR